jgi:hypothetical protein
MLEVIILAGLHEPNPLFPPGFYEFALEGTVLPMKTVLLLNQNLPLETDRSKSAEIAAEYKAYRPGFC